MAQDKAGGGCQEGCPLGKVLGQRECPGKKAKEKILEWLRGERPQEGGEEPPKQS